jgi:hypothetical protein
MSRPFRSSNKNIMGIFASYLVILLGLVGTMLIGVVSDNMNALFVGVALLAFLLIAMIPFSASRPAEPLVWRGERKLSLMQRIRRWFRRRNREERPPRPWKRRRTHQPHNIQGDEYRATDSDGRTTTFEAKRPG